MTSKNLLSPAFVYTKLFQDLTTLWSTSTSSAFSSPPSSFRKTCFEVAWSAVTPRCFAEGLKQVNDVKAALPPIGKAAFIACS